MRFVCLFHWIVANLMQPIATLAAAAGANQKRAKPPGDQSEGRKGGHSGSRLVTMKLRSDVNTQCSPANRFTSQRKPCFIWDGEM